MIISFWTEEHCITGKCFVTGFSNPVEAVPGRICGSLYHDVSQDCSEAVEMDKDVAAFSWNHNVHVATGTKNHS
ncbi:hypothetical protein AB3S75_022097 [Citrus x aurantiifolia]